MPQLSSTGVLASVILSFPADTSSRIQKSCSSTKVSVIVMLSREGWQEFPRLPEPGRVSRSYL